MTPNDLVEIPGACRVLDGVILTCWLDLTDRDGHPVSTPDPEVVALHVRAVALRRRLWAVFYGSTVCTPTAGT